VAPSATHVPEKQHAPCEQLPSPQHGAPAAPQAAQVPVVGEQTNPGCRHVAAAVPTAGQHVSPAVCPQEEHVPLTQRVPGAVHSVAVEPTLEGQHGWLGPPQLPQAPFAQAPGSGAQLAPAAAHRPDTQQPPPAQTLPPQQDWPGAPHPGPIGPSKPLPPASRGASGPLPSNDAGTSAGPSIAPSAP